MRKLKYLMAAGLAAFVLSVGTARVSAQQGGGRNFDPEQMRQRMMENFRERLDVKNDDEWKIIEAKIQKVLDARREAGGLGMGGFAFGRGGRRGGGGGGGAGAGGGGGGGARGGFFGEPSAEVQDLQKAVEANASSDEIKTKLQKVRQAQKDKEAKVEAAQEDLKKVLSVKQEAAAVLAGLVK